MGHDVPSDPDFEPECGFMTHDEAAILYNCGERAPGEWVDIGARLMWTSSYLAYALRFVLSVDPAFKNPAFRSRAAENLWLLDQHELIYLFPMTSKEFFAGPVNTFNCISGVCIDGNHDRPEPLNDAKGALAHLPETGVIVFHDFWGDPIREGVNYLLDRGLKCRVYDTPNGMAVCWRGDFTPPHHIPDPAIDWAAVRRGRASEFDFTRCS